MLYVHLCVGVGYARNIILLFRLYGHIFIDLVKRSVLTLVTEIPSFINDHYYYYKNSYYTDSFPAPSENFQFSHTHIQEKQET